MTEPDWKARSRQHEARAKEYQAAVRELTRELDVSKARERDWRSAYHSLRLTLGDRLDRIAGTLDLDYTDTETQENPR